MTDPIAKVLAKERAAIDRVLATAIDDIVKGPPKPLPKHIEDMIDELPKPIAEYHSPWHE